MKTAIGNAKLGYNCLVTSRPVGDTCPLDCYFLNNGCYAQATEKRFNNARIAARMNIAATANGILQAIDKANQNAYSIRIHERGDFFLNGELDLDYVNAWFNALNNRKDKLPDIWFYTHVLDKALTNLGSYGVSVYASVHNEDELNEAIDQGFKLFAWCSTIRKKRGGSKHVPKYIELPILGRTLVCPEQRLGRERVTCTGTENTAACNFCVKGRGNVIFLEH